jgi:sugar lactone lactonase YvrE
MLAWRGCAVAPDNTLLNDVAILPDGGFAVTHMYPKRHETLYSLAAVIGFSTGYVLEWQAAGGFHKVAGSDGRMPNGIEASKDGASLYVDMYLGGEVRKISGQTGETLVSADVVHPDNILWSPDGSLLVASHDTSLSTSWRVTASRRARARRGSRSSSSIRNVGKDGSLRERRAADGRRHRAIHVGNELIIGTFKGDRIAARRSRRASGGRARSGRRKRASCEHRTRGRRIVRRLVTAHSTRPCKYQRRRRRS